MVIWITGEKNKVEERRLGEAIAGAYEKAVMLHGGEFVKEFKLPPKDDRTELLLQYRLAVTARILERQGCLVVIAYTGQQVVIQSLRKLFLKSLPVIIDETVDSAVEMPFMLWHKGDTVHDRDDMVEEMLRRIKKEG